MSGTRRHWPLALAAAGVLLVAGLGGWWWSGQRSEPQAVAGGGFSVAGALSGEAQAEGFARVTGPLALRFPDDHGPHPAYRHEWWYVTGNLEAADGRGFGYQATFFRFNVDPEAPARASALATDQIWMAHLALSDVAGARFLHEERLARGAAGLAGGTAAPFRVWLDDWSLMSLDPEQFAPLHLRATADGFSVDLQLEPLKPLVLQGDRGYSRKGRHPGNASRYYSFTRLATTGTLTLAGEPAQTVTGSSWLDREWGSSTLDEAQSGWDWFSLQLDHDVEIMFYHLRLADGRIDPRSKGLWVAADGESRVLDLEQVGIEAIAHWASPLDGTRYPVAWRLRIPGEALELTLRARLPDQELRGLFRYWEGAITASGEHAGVAVSGVGYAELTGYTAPGADR
jgi:predicted secreted hydrolase